jgi:hypothetical protein
MRRQWMSWPLGLVGVLAAAGCSGHATSSASRDSLPRDTPSSQSNHQHFRLAPPGQSAVVMTACLHRGGVQVDRVPAALVGRLPILTVSIGTHGGSQISFWATPNVAKQFVIASGSFAGRVHRVGAVTFDLTGIPRVDRVISRCAANVSGHLS